MANLYNQNIGLNYQGMLNLGSTINTPLDAFALQYITDGMGNNSPILVSQSQVVIYSNSGASPFAVKAVTASTGGIDIWGATNGAGEYEFIRFRDFAGNLLSQIYQYNNLLTFKSGAVEIMKLNSTQVRIGTAFTAGQYLNTKLIVNNYASSGDEVANIGIFGSSQATFDSATVFGYGIYGHGYTNGSARSGGVVGEGMVTNSSDSGSAIGVRGYSLQTHAGGMNIGLYGNALLGSLNYALWMEAGDIQSTVGQTWTFASGFLTLPQGVISKTLLSSPSVGSGAINFNCNLADMFSTTLVTGTPTAITMSNARQGSYVVRLEQPAGGSATVTWATTIIWAGGTAPTLTTTANYSDIITLIYDGTTWRGTATLNFAS